MKKLILLSIILIVGCATIKGKYKDMFIADGTRAFFVLGMTEEEFNRKNPSIIEKLNESDEFTTYIESEQPYRYMVMFRKQIEIPQAFEEYMFEFKNDTLIAVYRGRNNYGREIDYSKYPNSKPK